MKEPHGSVRWPWRWVWLVVLVALTLGVASAKEQTGKLAIQSQSPSVSSDEASAEMNLPVPAWYAIVLHEPGKVRTLHTRKDTLFDPQDALRSFTILQVEANGVTLRENRTGRESFWRPGGSPEGVRGLTLSGTAMLNHLRYRYKAVERVTQAEPVLLALEGSMAVLEKQVVRKGVGAKSLPPPSDDRALNPTLSKLMRVQEVGHNTYEVNGAELRPALENVSQLISDLKVMVSPTVSAQSGVGFNVSSAVADGMLNETGFTVTNSKVAQVFGIEVGDTILQINSKPVTSPLNAWWAYQEFVVRNPTQSEVRVDIRREGSLVTKTFRFR